MKGQSESPMKSAIEKMLTRDSLLRSFIFKQIDDHEASYGLSSGKHAAAVLTGLTRLKMVDIANNLGISYSSLRTWSSGDPVYQGIEKSVMGLYSARIADVLNTYTEKIGVRELKKFEWAIEVIRKGKDPNEPSIEKFPPEIQDMIRNPQKSPLSFLRDQFIDAKFYLPDLIYNIGKTYFYSFTGDTERLASCRREEFVELAEIVFNGYLADLRRNYADIFIALAWNELETSLENLKPVEPEENEDPSVKENRESFSKGDYKLLRELMLADRKYHILLD